MMSKLAQRMTATRGELVASEAELTKEERALLDPSFETVLLMLTPGLDVAVDSTYGYAVVRNGGRMLLSDARGGPLNEAPSD